MALILIIEDDLSVLENLEEILTLRQFKVMTATSGNQGLEVARQHRPDLIVCDIMMPGLDGYQVIQTLRDQPETNNIPFIFLTAKVERPDQRLGMELGADDYICKPFQAADIIRAIDSRLKRQAVAMRACYAEIRQLLHEARHDALTQLPNRTVLEKKMAQVIQGQMDQTAKLAYALLFIDLDAFKSVNDTFGHWAGDQFLVQIAQRLTSCVRPNDLVARVGGDEFCVLLETLSGLEEAIDIAQRLQAAIAQPLDCNGHELLPSASIGITTSDLDYCSIEALWRDADVAMYQAKASGSSQCVVFDRHTLTNTSEMPR